MGEGAERLAEHLSTLLAPAKLLRLDRDSTRRPGRMEEILTAFARQEAQILVGTQMLSKGHHFPQVTLALVADGDLGLNLPDYRAAERSFQLLVQSAGRAGRGGRTGEVVIQTRDPSHYCWDFVLRGDYEGFYRAEIARREQRRYPPFVRLALARMSFDAKREEALAEVSRVGNTLRSAGRELGVAVLGPAPAPIPMVRGRKRFHCLLKARDWPAIRAAYAKAASAVDGNMLRLALVLDPVNML
jgi:primosomal protein N' (replication factor Y)